MFISVLDLFKIGIGPSSSHTVGPMLAAAEFIEHAASLLENSATEQQGAIRCILKGSLSATGKGHGTDRAIVLGLHGYKPLELAGKDVDEIIERLWKTDCLNGLPDRKISFSPAKDIVFDDGAPLPEHPNGMIFELLNTNGESLLNERWFSIGGGFIVNGDEIDSLVAPLKMESARNCPFPFDSALSMLEMSEHSGLSIDAMKRRNEARFIDDETLEEGLDKIWNAMEACIESGLQAEGPLPGGLHLERRAKKLFDQLRGKPEESDTNDWLCAYAMAVNEENASGRMVVTAPTNGAAGVIPAVLYYQVKQKGLEKENIHRFLLTAAAIGGLIKHRSSISGAEVGCQGEVGSAAAMAAAGLCAVRGGTSEQIENAAEIALEHHLGMTCDPVDGLVQVPCIERNGFGAIKAMAAASLALRGTGEHFMPLDACIEAMKQTGLEMSHKYKETSLGGLAVSITEC